MNNARMKHLTAHIPGSRHPTHAPMPGPRHPFFLPDYAWCPYLKVGWELGQVLSVEGGCLAVVRQAVLLIPALGERNALVSQDHTEAQALAAAHDCLARTQARDSVASG